MMVSPATLAGVLAGFLLTLAIAVAWGVAVAVAGHKPEPIESAAGGSSAAAPPSLAPERFSALDLNGDGKLSLAEAAGNSQVVTRFERADRNRDGKLTPREFERLSKLPEKPAQAKPAQAAKQPRRAPPPAP